MAVTVGARVQVVAKQTAGRLLVGAITASRKVRIQGAIVRAATSIRNRELAATEGPAHLNSAPFPPPAHLEIPDFLDEAEARRQEVLLEAVRAFENAGPTPRSSVRLVHMLAPVMDDWAAESMRGDEVRSGEVWS